MILHISRQSLAFIPQCTCYPRSKLKLPCIQPNNKIGGSVELGNGKWECVLNILKLPWLKMTLALLQSCVLLCASMSGRRKQSKCVHYRGAGWAGGMAAWRKPSTEWRWLRNTVFQTLSMSESVFGEKHSHLLAAYRSRVFQNMPRFGRRGSVVCVSK